MRIFAELSLVIELSSDWTKYAFAEPVMGYSITGFCIYGTTTFSTRP